MRTSTPPARPPEHSRRRTLTLTLLGCLAVASGTGLAGGLISCQPPATREVARPLSGAEARRLATMRVSNFQDGRVGLRATLGLPGAETEVVGTVDWGRELIYLAVTGAGAGDQRGLLQATPALVASRPEAWPGVRQSPARPTVAGSPAGSTGAATPRSGTSDTTGTASTGAGYPAGEDPSASAAPPVVPPEDGWRVRSSATGTAPTPLDSFLNLIFAAAASQPDRPEALERSDARWLGRDRAGGAAVDILLGPAVPQATWDTGPASPTPTTLTDMGGAVRYWLDSDARLHRLEALLGQDVPVQVDLDRTVRPEVAAVAALGGLPVLPRPVTEDEAELLSRVGTANRARGGATVALTVPTLPAQRLLPGDGPAVNLRGAGWIDWYGEGAYLGVHEIDEPTDRLLLRADPVGVAALPAVGDADQDGPQATAAADRQRDGRPAPAELPPLPAPIERAWSYREWPARTDRLGGLDLDLLISEALSAGLSDGADPATLRRSAAWLRRDRFAGQKVTVFEMPKSVEAGTPRGQARMRYWVDRSGLLRRLELRTRTGAFAQLDLYPGQIPGLPWVPTG
nr:hypothetical protein [Micromonospora sp. DSM 115978]